LYYQLAAYLFELKRWDKGLTNLENGLILDPAKSYILTNIFPELINVPSIKAMIQQYNDERL